VPGWHAIAELAKPRILRHLPLPAKEILRLPQPLIVLRLLALRLLHLRQRHQLLRLQLRHALLFPIRLLDQRAPTITLKAQGCEIPLDVRNLALEIIDLRLEAGGLDVVKLGDHCGGHQSERGQNRHGDNPFPT
jgi:hypothetical protein